MKKNHQMLVDVLEKTIETRVCPNDVWTFGELHTETNLSLSRFKLSHNELKHLLHSQKRFHIYKRNVRGRIIYIFRKSKKVEL